MKTKNDEILISLIEEANSNAAIRVADKPAIGVSDYERIESYRVGQILAGCRKYPGRVANAIWAAMDSDSRSGKQNADTGPAFQRREACRSS